MKRSKHSLSHYKLFTGNMGELIPVACIEALPGDTFSHATSALVRASPLLAPVMHPVTVRIHHWFVPLRLIWANFEKFITGGADGEGDGSAWPYKDAFTPAAGALGDYFGLPPGVNCGQVSALPFRAYALVFNENYRDEDLVTELTVNTGDGADATTPVTVQSIAWEKDYFTSAREWAQKGPAVTLPLGTSAPVELDPTTGVSQLVRLKSNHALSGAGDIVSDASGNLEGAGGADVVVDPNGTLFADLQGATGASIIDLREALGLQRYQEARARYGSRYTEYLRYCGVTPSDARLQRPEYLGGGKQVISFSEVLQTGTEFDSNDGVGTMRGHGIAALRSNRYQYFAQEHGLILTLMSVRPRTMYMEGVERMWTRSTKELYYQKELAHIGAQEVLNKEIYAAAATPTDVFGFQDRYAEYRHIQSKVAGEFRTTLNFWHLARDFAAEPALNASFVTCDPSTRIFASTATDGLWIMASNNIRARRPVPKNASPRIF